jgi:gamma-glutamylcyclotransferase (GGCT)/AIG2-like uncharacterized protein YtfP
LPHLVFVYGTLKTGERNHRHMAGARLVGPATTRHAAYSLFEYPSASVPGRIAPSVEAGGSHRIAGELYEIDDAHLARLDILERIGVDYLRTTAELSGGHLAHIYLRAPQSTRSALASLSFTTIEDGVANWSDRQ